MISISISWFVAVLIAGIIAIVLAAIQDGLKSSTFWFHLAFWIAALAFLSPFH